MTSSLHVSLPDEMRIFVDHRADGKRDFSTPSEYVRALIRRDMENEENKNYVYRELLKSAADMNAGRIYPASMAKDVANRAIEEFGAKADR